MMNLGSQMREIRKDLGLTCIEAAEQAGVNPANLSMIETGQRNGSIASINRILAVYGHKLAIVPIPPKDPEE